MFVCICNALTESDVRSAIQSGRARDPLAVYRHFDAEPQCGQCLDIVRSLLADAGMPADGPSPQGSKPSAAKPSATKHRAGGPQPAAACAARG